MAFDAGTIESRLVLDRSPFSRELRTAIAEAEAVERRQFKIRIGADTSDLRRGLNDTEQGLKRVEGQARRTRQETEKSLNPLLTAALLLGPALIPLTGGLVAIGSAALGMAAVAVPAVAGIKREIAQNTALGKQYSAQLGVLKQDWNQLGHAVAQALGPAFDQGTAKINQFFPQLRSELSSLAPEVGSIVSHLTGGLLGGFGTFLPVMQHVLALTDQLAARFETWATGPGGAHFATALNQDFDMLVQLFSQLGPALAHVVEAARPFGVVVVDELRIFSEVINSIPLPILQAIVTSLLAMKVAGVVNLGILALTKGLRGLAVAEGEAAAAGGARGLSGSLAAGLSRLSPYILGAVALGVVAKTVADNTKDWAGSTDALKNTVHYTSQAFGDLLSLNFSGFGKTFGQAFNSGQMASQINEARRLQRIFSTETLQGEQQTQRDRLIILQDAMARQRQILASANSRLVSEGRGSPNFATDEATASRAGYELVRLGNAASAAKTNLALATRELVWATNVEQGYALAVKRSNDAMLASVQRHIQRNGQIAESGQYYDGLTKQLQKQIDAEKEFLPVAKDHGVTVSGITYSYKAWNDAVAQANGDMTTAQAILRGHTQAIGINKDAVAEANRESANLSNAVGLVESKYKLTDQQVDLYTSALGVNVTALAQGSLTAAEYARAIGAVVDAFNNGDASIQGWLGAIDQFNKSGDTVVSRAALIGAALRAANGDALGYANTMVGVATANQGVVDAFKNLNKGVIDWTKGTIDYHNAAAAPLLQSLQQVQDAAMQAAGATYQHELRTRGATQAADDAYNVYVNDTRNALIDEAKHFGVNADEAKRFADQYFGIANAKDVKKRIEMIGQDKILQALNGMLKDLDIIAKGTHFKVDADASQAFTVIDKVRNALLTIQGGLIVKVQTGNGVFSNTASARGNIVQYAGGGFGEDHSPQIFKAQPNTVRVFAEPETSWEAYIPGANDGRRPRAKAIAAETVRRLGGVAKFESGGITGLDYSTPAGSQTGPGGQTVSTIKSLFNVINNEINQLPGLAKRAASSVISATTAILNNLTKAYHEGLVSSSFLDHFKQENDALINEVKKRDQITGQLKSAQNKLKDLRREFNAEQANVAQATLQGFDITTSGNGYASGIKATLEQKIKDATKFQQLLAKAKALGLDPRLIRQLAEAGPEAAGANLQAIVSAGAGYIKTLDTEYAQLNTTAQAIGKDEATALYGSQIAKYQEQIHKLTAQQLAEQKLINKNLSQMTREFKNLSANLLVEIRRLGG